MTNRNKSASLVYALGFIANLLVCYFVFFQISKINALNSVWQEQTRANIELALQIKEIERGIGYVGFIHHFKNYIIRGDEVYFKKSQDSYKGVKTAISKVYELGLNDDELGLLEQIEATMDVYYSKLELAQSLLAEGVDIVKLDDAVRVDDSMAESALISLRQRLLPRLAKLQAETDVQMKSINQQTVTSGIALIIFFIIFSALALYNIKRFSSTVSNLKAIFDAAPDGIISVDTKGKIIQSNKSARAIFGYSYDEFIGLSIEQLIEKNEQSKHAEQRKAFLSSKEAGQTSKVRSNGRIFRGVDKNGHSIPLSIAISKSMESSDVAAVCLIKDMTQQLELKEASEFDHLTKLNNRRHFDLVLKQEIDRAKRDNASLTLMLIDVDNFKTLNDTHGHDEGDKALKTIAEFLKSHLRSYDHVARWGGDEFTLLCPKLKKPASLERAIRLCDDFQHLKFDVENDLSLSIGVAILDSRIDTPDSLLKKADSAVYEAKKAGKNQVRLFE